ncbi:hypothetical protein ACE6H2_018743 [Prunus campanulata]
MQDLGANAVDFDDDEGVGLIIIECPLSINSHAEIGSQWLWIRALPLSILNSTGVSLPTAPLLGAASPLAWCCYSYATLPSIELVFQANEKLFDPAVEVGGGFF